MRTMHGAEGAKPDVCALARVNLAVYVDTSVAQPTRARRRHRWTRRQAATVTRHVISRMICTPAATRKRRHSSSPPATVPKQPKTAEGTPLLPARMGSCIASKLVATCNVAPVQPAAGIDEQRKQQGNQQQQEHQKQETEPVKEGGGSLDIRGFTVMRARIPEAEVLRVRGLCKHIGAKFMPIFQELVRKSTTSMGRVW